MTKTEAFLLERRLKARLLTAVAKENPPLSFFEDLFCCTISHSKERFSTPYASIEDWKTKVNDKLTVAIYKLDGPHLLLLEEALDNDHLLLALKIIGKGRKKVNGKIRSSANRSNLDDLTL